MNHRSAAIPTTGSERSSSSRTSRRLHGSAHRVVVVTIAAATFLGTSIPAFPEEPPKSPTAAAAPGTDAGAASAPSPPPPAAEARPTVKDVKIDGDIPRDMYGRWLVVATLTVPNGRTNTAGVLEIAPGTDGPPHLDYRTNGLPSEVMAGVDKANKDQKTFNPDATLVSTVGTKWGETVPDLKTGLNKVEYFFKTADQYDDALKAEALARDTTGTLIVSRFPRPLPGYSSGLVRNDMFFFFKSVTPEKLSGPHTNFQLVAAFAPAPVTLHGEFVAYRVPGAQEAKVGAIPPSTASAAPSASASKKPGH